MIGHGAWPVDPGVLPAFLAAMALIELTPGPNMAWLAALSVVRGRMAGLAAVAGITVGLATYLAAATFGLTELLLVWPPAYDLLRWAGVAFLLWLAWEGWRGADGGPEGQDGMSGSRGGLFWRGFLANILNPKAALFYVTLLPGFIQPGHASPAAQVLALGGVHIVLSLAVHGGIVLGAATTGRLLAATMDEARLAWVRRGFAIGIAVVAVWMAWQTRRG